MKKKILNVLLVLILLTLSSCIYIKPSQAYSTDATISNKWFYIKNAYSGRYLDVYMGKIFVHPPWVFLHVITS